MVEKELEGIVAKDRIRRYLTGTIKQESKTSFAWIAAMAQIGYFSPLITIQNPHHGARKTWFIVLMNFV